MRRGMTKDKFLGLLALIIMGLCLLLAIIAIVCSIAAVIMYGGKPVTEIPAWALMFMFGNKGN